MLQSLVLQLSVNLNEPQLPYIMVIEIQTGAQQRGAWPERRRLGQKGPFGAISAPPLWLWGAEELVPIGPEKAPIGPEKAPICHEKARFPRRDFPPIFSENLGLKPPFLSPRLDFPEMVLE